MAVSRNIFLQLWKTHIVQFFSIQGRWTGTSPPVSLPLTLSRRTAVFITLSLRTWSPRTLAWSNHQPPGRWDDIWERVKTALIFVQVMSVRILLTQGCWCHGLLYFSVTFIHLPLRPRWSVFWQKKNIILCARSTSRSREQNTKRS